MSGKIAYIHGGNSSQLRSFQDFCHHIDEAIHLEELPDRDLDSFAAVVVADAMSAPAIAAHRAQLNAYARQGGFLIVFFQGHADWIDVIDLEWKPIGTRDWLWWTKPGERLEIHQPNPDHPLCQAAPLPLMSWHWGGVYAEPPGSISLLRLDDGQGSIFLDIPQLPGGGRLMLATLDPHSHNGQRFMGATTRFLQAFYPWLDRELAIERRPRNRVTYLQCTHHVTDWQPAGLADSLGAAGLETRFVPLQDLVGGILGETDILYLPSNHDEHFLARHQEALLSYLAGGGSMILCAEPATRWLPFLAPFNAVPPRPFQNIKVRVSDPRGGFFANMEDGFDGWKGIFGQYARGWSDMPPGAIQLTAVGPQHDPKPADWLWRHPAKNGRGGFVFMHNGDNMIRYPDHGPHKEQLVRDICLALQALMTGKRTL